MGRRPPEQVAADMTPNAIAANLIQLSYELDDLVKEYRFLGEGAAEAKREAEVAYAKAYMSTSGTVEVGRTLSATTRDELKLAGSGVAA